MASVNALYNPRILALATGLSDYPLDPAMQLSGSARSQTCGSVVSVGLDLDGSNRIDRVGLKAQACAIGQAAASVFATGARHKNAEDLTLAKAEIEGWLAGEGELPAWPGIDAIAAAADYPARHGAILLPWKAALSALSNLGDGS